MKYSALLFLPAASVACAAEESVTRSSGFNGSTTTLVSWMVSTLAVVALIFVLAWLLKKTRLVRRIAGGRIQVVSQVGLGPKERVVEIEVDGRSILLGVTPSAVNYLCELNLPASFSGELKAQQELKAPQVPPEQPDGAGTGETSEVTFKSPKRQDPASGGRASAGSDRDDGV